ncbi:RNA-directed DNA polymerase from mobile element jockey [Trichonephila clavipes]|nr:RNA-directed DNA polymerase from mobile element jockey [Trichonephila clavipes]
MNSSQHRCTNQASASEAQTQQCSLNSSLGDTFGSLLVHFGGQLLNGSPSICPNASPQPSFASVIYGPWCTTFATSLILNSPILPCTVHFYHAACEQFTNSAVSEMLPPLARKPMILPFWTSDKSLRFCITPMIEMFSEALRHPLYTLNCTVLPPAFCDWLFNSDVEKQHGFRPRLSTTHQLLRVVEYIKDGIDRHQYTAAVFLDIQKAFDRVWHTGLLFKLIMYKIPPPLIFLLKSYISDRSFTVKINITFSQVRPAKAGVAQGSILGPVLFNLYVNDILKTTNTMICMYADDTAILSRHYNPNTLTQNINEHLAHLEIWFSVWKIALNTTKTEAVFFTQRRPPPEITLQNQRIPWSQHTKYLDVIIDKNLTLRQHITYVRNKFKNATRQLYSLICKKSKLNRHNKMLIYTLILKPLLTYASPIWAHAARTNINLIEISQNVILRQILDAHWYMRNADIRSALKIPTIRQTIRKLANNFFSNIDGHENPSIQAIPTYPTYPFIRIDQETSWLILTLINF